MFENLHILKIAGAMSKHAGARQALISQNVANADTPGFHARDIPSFKSIYQEDHTQRATRSKHLNGAASLGGGTQPFVERNMASPDGNTVSIEREMLKAAETFKQHNRALTIYKSTLGILRATIGKG